MSKQRELYALTERLVVMSPGDADGLENDPEPVVCIAAGLFTSRTKAEKLAEKLNVKEDAPKRHERFAVKPIRIRAG
jgi:hypothetical protein